jgi:hypothetical protein
MQIERSKNHLHSVNDEKASAKALLNSYCISCEHKRQEAEHLNNELSRLESLVSRFKTNNEEYLNKIKQAAEEKVKDVLTNSKLLLKFATFSVIESLRSYPELYNFVIHDNSNNTTPISYGPNYHSLMLSRRQQHQQYFNDSYTTLILEEAEKLYNKLTTELTNSVIATAAGATAIRTSSLPSSGNNNRHKLDQK